MGWVRFGFLFLLSVALVGCGRHRVKITFDSVSEQQKQLLKQDFDVLADLPSGNGDQTILEVSEFSGSGISAWTGERLKYIIGNAFDFSDRIENNLGQPLSNSSTQGLKEINSSAYGANLGSYLWVQGEQTQSVYTIAIDGNSVAVTTPRVGIEQVTDQLFGDRMIPGSPMDSKANSLIRLATMAIHEPRHTDGHAEGSGSSSFDNATFPHVLCDNQNRGKKCDASANGPNGAAAAFLKFAMSVCSECTDAELEGIRTVMADMLSRINRNSPIRDVTPATGG